MLDEPICRLLGGRVGNNQVYNQPEQKLAPTCLQVNTIEKQHQTYPNTSNTWRNYPQKFQQVRTIFVGIRDSIDVAWLVLGIPTTVHSPFLVGRGASSYLHSHKKRFFTNKRGFLFLPWEPKTFILRGYDPYLGPKTFIFHGFGVQRYGLYYCSNKTAV